MFFLDLFYCNQYHSFSLKHATPICLIIQRPPEKFSINLHDNLQYARCGVTQRLHRDNLIADFSLIRVHLVAGGVRNRMKLDSPD
jgi:hypothetical protein